MLSNVNCCPFGLPLVPKSLAVHPDKITIATGQVAGTSSDGKVREFILSLSVTLSCLEGCPQLNLSVDDLSLPQMLLKPQDINNT